MNRSALHRAPVALVAALYLLGGAEHWYGEPCPHHDAALLAAQSVDAAQADDHAHHGGSPDAPAPHGEDHGPCACIGPCTTPAPTALPAASAQVAVASLERVESTAPRPRDVALPQFVPYLLPYAHAPPSLG